MISDALKFDPVHFLQKVITFQYIPSKDLDIARWKNTLMVDWVNMSLMHFYRYG